MPTNVQLTRLTPADDAAARDAAHVLAAAFDPADHHVQRALLAELSLAQQREATRLQMLQAVWRGVRDKEVWVATSEGAIGAVMVVAPPAAARAQAERPASPYDGELAALTPPAAVGAFAALQAASWAAQAAAFDPPKEEGYHVSLLGTAPGSQRRGLAGALVRSVLARAREERRAVTITTYTEENAAYYVRLGFVERARNTFDVRGVPVTFWILSAVPGA
ncbi:hypothetical protein Q8F55_004906 [Vanrija albida]|uniref:N-acetyltransferase domain-containing protein n=1 Tax=Vanrija albida TaxID=181172 RepID=A0ABR3Q0D3_9TREE